MPWYFLAHVIYKVYGERAQGGQVVLSINELWELLSSIWKKYRVALYDNRSEMEEDLGILSFIGALQRKNDKLIVNVERLKSVERDMETDPYFRGKGFFLTYFKKRLDEALEKELSLHIKPPRPVAPEPR